MTKRPAIILFPIFGLLFLFQIGNAQTNNAQTKETHLRSALGSTSSSLLFGTGDTYVTMGAAPELGLSEFTLEAWFRMDGLGGPMGTGSHGVHAYPIIAKGSGNSDPPENRLDINYLLGIQTPADGPRVLVADFECTEANPFRHGMNHTVYGVTEIEYGDWHHVAVTYDGFEWRLYLDGDLEMRTVHRMTPQYESWHHFGVGTALDNKGNSNGRFKGAIDEVRVWNYARTQPSIRQTINEEIIQEEGLLGRWGFNEGSGVVAEDSSGNEIHGDVVNAEWTGGAPFSINLSSELSSPCPAEGSIINNASVELSVDVNDNEQDDITAIFYGREKKVRENTYTIAVIPDTQHYVSNNFLYAEYFDATTQFIVDNRDELNIRYVAHVGDIVQDADYTSESAHAEMQYADNAISILDTLPDLPYGLTVGNHDEFPKMDPCCTELFNEHFPYTRYEGVAPWYGGHFGDNNDTHYILFDGGGTDYIAIHTEYRNPAPAEEILAWMDELLTLHPDRKAIVVLHEVIMPGGAGHQAKWDDQGEAVYDTLKHHPNFFMMLAGHRHGEGRRIDTLQNGNTVYSLMHNFQIRPASGASYLRLLEFAPNDEEIVVRTYAPALDEYETDPDSEFSLGVDVPGGPWTQLGIVFAHDEPTVSHMWQGLTEGKAYEWRVELLDSNSLTKSEIYTFKYETSQCMADINANGNVDTHDLLTLIGEWGECYNECATECLGDLTHDGAVDVEDILILISLWGLCP